MSSLSNIQRADAQAHAYAKAYAEAYVDALEKKRGQAAEQPAKQTVEDNYLGPRLTIKHTRNPFPQIIKDLADEEKCGIPVCGIVSVPKFRSITLTPDVVCQECS